MVHWCLRRLEPETQVFQLGDPGKDGVLMPKNPRCNRCQKPMLNPVDVAAGRCVECQRVVALAAAPPRSNPALLGRDAPQPRHLSPGAAWEELIGLGLEAAQSISRNQWLLGDLAIQVLIGRQSEALEDFAGRIGMDYMTLQNLRRTALAFPKGDRQHGISFSHHEALCAREDRAHWALAAAEGKWSRQRMLDTIRVSDSQASTRGGNGEIQTLSEPTYEERLNSEAPSITNHDTPIVSEPEAVNTLLEGIPGLIETPVPTWEQDYSWAELEAHAVDEIQKLARFFWDETTDRPGPGENIIDLAIRLLRG